MALSAFSLLIKRLMIKSTGMIVYETDSLHNITFVKNLLEYSGDYSRSVTKKNSLWYLDADGTTPNTNTRFEARKLLTARDDALNAGGKDVNLMIPPFFLS